MFNILLALMLWCLPSLSQGHTDSPYHVEKEILRLSADQPLTLDYAQRHNQWQSVKEFGNHGFTADTFWLKLNIKDVAKPQELIASLVYPLHDEVRFYYCVNGTIQYRATMGDTIESGNWVLDNKAFSIPITVIPEQAQTLYIQVLGKNSKVLGVTLETPEAHQNSSQWGHIFAGALYGILLIMALYNLSLAFLIRDLAYLSYVMYVACFGFFALSVTGDGFYYLWSDSPKFNHYAIALAGGILIIPTMLFPYLLLNVKQNAPLLKPFYFGYVFLATLYIGAVPWLDGDIALKLINVLSLSATPFLLISGCYAIYKRVPVAKIYTAAWFVLTIGLAILSLSAYNVLPSNVVTRNANIIGGILEMVLLSIALAQRIHIERKAKLSALSDMHMAKQAMRSYQKMSQELFESAPVGIFRIDEYGKISAANPAFCELIGLQNANYTELNDAKVTECFLDYHALARDIQNNNTVIDRETLVIALNGKQRTCSVTLKVKRQKDRLYLQGYLTDISARKHAQHIQDVMEKARMASLEQLVTGVAHEINTPLGINITSLSCIKDDLEHIDTAMNNGKLTKESFRSFVQDSQHVLALMQDNLTRISNLVSRFKLVSVQHLSTKKEKLALKAYAKEILMVHLAGLDHIQAKVTTHDCEIVMTYPAALNIILDQLIENSLLHGFHNQSTGNITLDFRQHRHQLIVTYRDDGTGVSEDFRSKIFDPFVTTRRGSIENAGLGLYRVYNLVKQVLKGDIELLDEPGFALQIAFDL